LIKNYLKQHIYKEAGFLYIEKKMVSKKVITVVFILAILMFAFSIIIGFSNAGTNSNKVVSNNNVESDVENGQVSIIVNKPVHSPN